MSKITIAEAKDRGRTKAAWILSGFQPLQAGETYKPEFETAYVLEDSNEARIASLETLSLIEQNDRQYTPHIADVFYEERDGDRQAELWDAYESALYEAFVVAANEMEAAGLMDAAEADEAEELEVA